MSTLAALALAVAGLVAPCEAPETLIVGAQVWTDARWQEVDLHLRDGRIDAIAAGLQVASAQRRIDASGLRIIPGLIDAHVHLYELGGPYPPGWDRPPYVESTRLNGRALLRSGVTSARVHLSNLQSGSELKLESMSPCAPLPRLQLGGPGVIGGGTTTPGFQTVGVEDAAQAHALTAAYAAAGVDWIALHQLDLFEPAQLRLLIESARRQGLRIMAAGDSVAALRLALQHGVDSVEYLPTDAVIPEDLLAALVAPSAPPVVAPIGYYRRIASALQAPSAGRVLGTPAGLSAPESRHFASRFDTWLRAQGHYQDAAQLLPMREANFRKLLDAGAGVLLGTDVGSAGHYHDRAIWTEIAAWRAAGMADEQVIDRGTRLAAAALGYSDLGRIEVGAVADLLILDRAIAGGLRPEALRYVLKAGVVHRHPDPASK